MKPSEVLSIVEELKNDKEIKALVRQYEKFKDDTTFKIPIDINVPVRFSLDPDSFKPYDNYIDEYDLTQDALRKVAPLMKDHRKAYAEKAKQFKKDAMKLLKNKVASVIKKNSMKVKLTPGELKQIFYEFFN